MTLPHFRVPIAIDDKGGGDYDPVTAADRDAEAVIRAAIAKAFPDHGIRGEEHGFERRALALHVGRSIRSTERAASSPGSCTGGC